MWPFKKSIPTIDWDKYDYSNTEEFHLTGEFVGKVVKLYDADTWTICFSPFKDGKVYRYNCRLMGIDSPEKRAKCKLEKQLCIDGQQWLQSIYFDKLVKVKIDPIKEKFGRLLVHLYDINSGECINDMIVHKNFAVSYFGKTKMNWPHYLHGSGECNCI